jgi:hypothetical protein
MVSGNAISVPMFYRSAGGCPGPGQSAVMHNALDNRWPLWQGNRVRA